jgi:hypothetical protein
MTHAFIKPRMMPLYEPRTKAAVQRSYRSIRGERPFTSSHLMTADEQDAEHYGDHSLWSLDYEGLPKEHAPQSSSDEDLTHFGTSVLLLSNDRIFRGACLKTITAMIKDRPTYGNYHVLAFKAGLLAIGADPLDHLHDQAFHNGHETPDAKDLQSCVAVSLDPDTSNHAMVHTVEQMNLFLDAFRCQLRRETEKRYQVPMSLTAMSFAVDMQAISEQN